jgi:hypothetical protein
MIVFRLFPLLILLIVLRVHAAEPTLPALRDELLAMAEVDQASRKAMVSNKDVDGPHLKRLQEIVVQYGWPTFAMVGEDGGHAAWLLAQHADRDIRFQRKVLALMEPLLAQGQAALKDYAYLYDRTHDPQRYATQGLCVSREQWQPFETEDPAGLADRRKAAGLSSLDEYVKQMNGICADGYLPGSSALQFRKAQLSEGEDVVVATDGIEVAGETVHTPEELMKLLAARQILKIRVKSASNEVHYTTLGKIIYGAQRAGILVTFVE